MPHPIHINQPILTVKLAQATMEGLYAEDVALHLKVQERGSRQVRTWLGKNDVLLYQQPWQNMRRFTRVRFHLAPDSPVFANGQAEQFSRLAIPDWQDWPAQGQHRTHEVAIRRFEGPENASRIAELSLKFAWYLSANAMDVISYLCQEMDRHAHSHSIRVLRQLDQVLHGHWPTTQVAENLPLLMPAPKLKILLKNLSRAWFSWLFRPGNPWFYTNFIHDNFGGWSLDADKGICYNYAIWTDLLYGFLGKSAGFSTKELLCETGLEDASGGLHDLGMMAVIEDMALGKFARALERVEENLPLKMQLLSMDERIKRGIPCGKPNYRDAAAVQLGAELWQEKGMEIKSAEGLIIKKLRLAKVHKKVAPEGVPPKEMSPLPGLNR